MKIALILTLSFLFSCASSSEVSGPVKCLQSTKANELVLHQSELDSSLSFYSPESWLTEFNINSEGTSINSSDTAKDLEHTLIVNKSSYHYPANELMGFYQTSFSYLIDELGIALLDSGIYTHNETHIYWIKYYNPSDTFSKSNVCLELFYADTSEVSNFRIIAYGVEKMEDRICEGYQIFLVNK